MSAGSPNATNLAPVRTDEPRRDQRKRRKVAIRNQEVGLATRSDPRCSHTLRTWPRAHVSRHAATSCSRGNTRTPMDSPWTMSLPGLCVDRT